ISYGMYLWYWPVLLVMTPVRTHLDGVGLLGARMLVIVAIAAASFHFVETPFHRGWLAGWRSLIVVPLAAVVVSLLPLMVPSASAVVPPVESAASAYNPTSGDAMAAPIAGPVRILLVGDSMVGSLGVGLSAEAAKYGAQIVNEGDPGCSVGVGDLVKVLWYTQAPGVPCTPGSPDEIINTYRSLVRKYDPDVVVYLARSETLDTELNGTWQNLGDPTFNFWTEARFDQALTALSSNGAHVVLLSSPYYDTGDQSDGTPWPENQPARVVEDNRLLAAAARDNRRTTSVFQLGALLSPDNQYKKYVDGVQARCGDGVHLTVPGGEWVGKRLLPKLVALGQTHLSLHSTLSRPALPPQTQPWWYGFLPCKT
ncbi:MAG TPA: SGNH hydrolase domain-containing protein, partial [Acidimicrobiales bacterium]|nr:SGNH hydrolase domain-containing protein [Acidimicrobiales bacterium]